MTKEKMYWQLPEAPRPAGLVCEMPSLTVPDQHITVNDVLRGYQNGLLVEGNSQDEEQWNDEIENPIGIDLKRLDLSEMETLHRNANAVAEEFETQKAEAWKIHQEKSAKQELDKAVVDQLEKLKADKGEANTNIT